MMFKKKMKDNVKKKFDTIFKNPSFVEKPLVKKQVPLRNKLIPILSASLTLMLAGGITLSVVLVSQKSHEKMPFQNSSNQPIDSSDLTLKPISQKAMRLDNQNEILREFESNASFIFGGNLTRNNGDGKAVTINDRLIEIDSSEFKEGAVGNYTIKCRLKNDDEALVSYNVLVNNEIIDSLKIDSFRNTYYVGETVLLSDVSVTKVMKSEKNVKALPTEYALDTSKFDTSKPGKTTLTVYLLTNPNIKKTYEVDVKPLDEINLKGDYAYICREFKVGEPIFYAFSIDEEIKPEYSEILAKGKYERHVNNSGIVLEVPGDSQTMRYVPKDREMIVSGIAGDPDMHCFKLTDRDVYITMSGGNDVSDKLNIVAKNGYLSNKTLDYFKFNFGGVYFDAGFNNEVDSMHHFDNQVTLYLGVKSIPVSNEGFIGDWYSPIDVNKMKITITKEGMSSWGAVELPSYTTTEYEEYITIRAHNGIYEYDKIKGTLFTVDNYDGSRGVELRKYDSKTQALVTYVYNNMGHKYVYVYNLGDSLNKTFVYESRISSIEVTSIYTIDENGNQIEKAYHNEPILEDLIIANGANYNRSMSDYWGTYGKDYTDFWRLTDKSNADRMNNDPHYDYLVHYEMGETTRVGWVEFSRYVIVTYQYEGKDNRGNPIYDENGDPVIYTGTNEYYYGNVHFEDGETIEIKFPKTTTGVDIGSGWMTKITYIWNLLPFIGTYKSSSGKQIDISKSGALVQYLENAQGYSYTTAMDGFITFYSNDKITAKFVEFDNNYNRTIHNIDFLLSENRYIFELNGNTYTQE